MEQRFCEREGGRDMTERKSTGSSQSRPPRRNQRTDRSDRNQRPQRPGSDKSKRFPRNRQETRTPLRPRKVEPEIPLDVEAKMLPGKVRAELLSLSAENAEVVARQMVMIDRLLASGNSDEIQLALAFGKAASNRAGRVGVVRQYAGRAALFSGDYAEAKRHLSAAFRINGQIFLKVLLAECESGLSKPRKALELLGEVPSSSLTKREMAYALIVSAEARELLGQIDAARVTLNPKVEVIFEKEGLDDDHELLRMRERWSTLKARLSS